MQSRQAKQPLSSLLASILHFAAVAPFQEWQRKGEPPLLAAVHRVLMMGPPSLLPHAAAALQSLGVRCRCEASR